jgi:transcriptional regulator with XRE-family HTH domain
MAVLRKSIYTEEYKLMLDTLRRVREVAGVTQAELANRLGITQSALSKWERGERRMDIIEVRNYCLAMEIDFLAFITDIERHLVELEKQ